MKIVGNLDWRHPLVRLRMAVAGPIQNALALAGRWEPLSKAETTTHQTDGISVDGDRPTQHRLVYSNPRQEFIDADNITYTPNGIAYENGKCITRYSLRTPSTAEILSPPTMGDAKNIPAGTIVETETPYTYGDWVGDYVRTLINADKIISPLILPAFLASKTYVVRDLKALRIEYIIADETICIEKARILRKQIPSYYWGPRDVAAFQKAFAITPPPARPGSLIYLARFDTQSEAAQRHYPSEAVAEIVEALGGKVFDTRNASPEEFDRIAPEMETVIADQGSALFGVMHSQTQGVIELAQDDWWHNANLFIANGAGVKNYAVIHLQGKDDATLRKRIERHLQAFNAMPSV